MIHYRFSILTNTNNIPIFIYILISPTQYNTKFIGKPQIFLCEFAHRPTRKFIINIKLKTEESSLLFINDQYNMFGSTFSWDLPR